MKTPMRAIGIIGLALVPILVSAQATASTLNHFSRNDPAFDYSVDVKLTGSAEQDLVLTEAQGAHDIPDSGSVTGTNYANKYFGFTLTIPSGWSVQDSDLKKQMSEKGKELLTSDDPAKKGELNRAVDNTLNLLTITERPFGSLGPISSFICGAERPASGVKTDADYMLALKKTIKYAEVPITIEKDVYSEQIGGVAYSVIAFNTNYSGVILSQKYYAHIVKNYVLFFIMTYQTDQQLKTPTEIVRSITPQ